MKDKYVVDSSIWIEMERKNEAVLEVLRPIIEKNEVCIVDLIMAEVLRGVKSANDYKVLSDVFLSFNLLSTSWLKVAELAFAVAKKGFRPPLTDLYIAQCVIENKRCLLTQDRDFLRIRSVKHFELQMI